MGALWEAERVVTEDLVLELLGQFPDLEVDSLHPLSDGWDRSVWLVNDAFVFGFPRRAVVVPGLEREIAFLPRLAPLLTLPIPVPAFVGHGTATFPWPFFGSALVPGQESGEAGLNEPERVNVGVEFAGFLRRLHSADVAEALGIGALPLDSNKRADMALRVPKVRASLLRLERSGLWRRAPKATELLGEAERLPASTSPPVVAHGDLHFRHLLVHDRRASGVIDWIDLCRADAAIDLQLVWSFIPPAGREAFIESYGPVDESQLLRARVIALSLAADLALYAHAERHESLQREALAGLERALAS